jgi:hypothetical protein
VKLARSREIHAGLVLIDRGSLIWMSSSRSSVPPPPSSRAATWLCVNIDGTMEFEDIPPP